MRQTMGVSRAQVTGLAGSPWAAARCAHISARPAPLPQARRSSVPPSLTPRTRATEHSAPSAPATESPPSGNDAMAELAKQLELLRRENALLRGELEALKSGGDATAAIVPEKESAAAAAGASSGDSSGSSSSSSSGGGAGGGSPVAAVVDPIVRAAEAVAGAVAAATAPSKREPAPAAAPGLRPVGGPEAFMRALEAGIAWPDPSSAFWDAPPRKAPMPVDIGKGSVSVPPRDARPLDIVHMTAELAPIAKVGGLGDVVTGLARTCLARGHSVAVMMPFYECLPLDQIEGLRHEMDITVPKGRFWDGQMQLHPLETSIFSGRIAGVPVYLIKPADSTGSGLFRGGRIYGGSYNETEAYLYFCRASLEFLRASGQNPAILHVHEWQTCAAAMLYWEVFNKAGLHKPRVVLTIHNMDNTGEVRQDEFMATGVPGEGFASVDRALDERTIGHNPERLNLMKGGIVYANAVTTVSPSYAGEILSGGAAGWLRGTLTKPEIRTKVRGIINGIDVEEWNPSTDVRLPANYNAQFPEGKALCKKYLQRGLGLAEDPSKPIVAVITRLVPQKGIHLIRAALYRTLEKGGQFVLLGSGHCDGDFRRLAENDFKNHPDVSLSIFYSEALSRQIYAAADLVLVPSMFEPCGLTQMIGMRYGAVPVVRRTGGLGDTVRDVQGSAPGEGNGYVFDGTDEGSLFSALDRAISDFSSDPAAWGELARNNMNAELSWTRPAEDYVAIYNTLAGVA